MKGLRLIILKEKISLAKNLKFRTQRLLIFILLSAFSFQLSTILIGCAKNETEDIYRETTAPVSIYKVARQDLKEFLFYSGDIEARDEATVYSKVTGKIVENKFQESDSVEKGECLALVDRDEIGYDFELAPVTSPISGVVGRVYLDKGANVTLATPVALIVNMDEVQVKIDVTEKDLPKLKRDQIAEVKVDAYSSEIFQGRVLKISPVVDLNTRTAPVWINIANPQHRLKPGMFARIKLMVGERQNALVVMRDAVIEEDSQRYVFIAEKKRASKKKVELGLESDGKYEVVKGLKEGDQAIVLGPSDLKDGDSVKIVEEKM